MKKPKDDGPRPWMVTGFAVMAIYLGLLGGGVTYAYVTGQDYDKRIERLIENNRFNAAVAKAEGCINSHERTDQIRKAIEAAIPDIQNRIDSILETPACDLDKALADLERLERER